MDMNTQYYKDMNYLKSNAIQKKKSKKIFMGFDKLIQKSIWKKKILPQTAKALKKEKSQVGKCAQLTTKIINLQQKIKYSLHQGIYNRTV